jgi:hypothetical protein
MLIPSRARWERFQYGLCRARKGVGGSLEDRLRDVPAPRETVSRGEGPAAWIHGRASELQEEMPVASSVLDVRKAYFANRERELGLDRRETG